MINILIRNMGLRRKAYAAMLIMVVLFDDAEADSCDSDEDCTPALECSDNTSNYITHHSLGTDTFSLNDVYDINIDDSFTGTSKL